MAEKEFIERGAVSKKIDALEVPVFYADGNLDCYQEGFKDALKQVVEILENQPVANVQEIRHGKWIDGNGEDAGCCSDEVFCSQCDYEAPLDSVDYYCRGGKIRYELTSICPHCGAIMDEEEL